MKGSKIIQPSSCKLWLPFSEGTGSTAYDRSGNNNNGTLVNSPTWVDGKFGKGLNLNGVNQYISINSKSELQTTPITISAWVYPKNYSTFSTVLNKSMPDLTSQSYNVSFTNVFIQFLIYTTINTPVYIRTTETLPLNLWSKIDCVYSTSEISVYKNGKKLNGTIFGTVGSSIKNTTETLYIGYTPSRTYNYNGYIDDIRIYNRALTAKEISYLYNSR